MALHQTIKEFLNNMPPTSANAPTTSASTSGSETTQPIFPDYYNNNNVTNNTERYDELEAYVAIKISDVSVR